MGRTLILLYHRLLSRKENLSKINSEERVYLLKEEEFIKQLEYLHSEEWNTISVEQLLESLKNRTSLPEKSLIISFDDGNQTDYTIAFPLLEKLGFKATFFLTSDFIDTPGHLSKSQIQKMSQAGMEFGTHGKTHKFLSTLDENELKLELQESKKVLEEITGKKIDLLSLPGGYHSSKVKRMGQELGYKGICTSKFGLNENNTDPFELKRISLRFDDPFSQFISIVNQDKKLYLKKKLRGNFLSFLKAILGPNNYFKLWNFYQRISTKKN
ncbi:MAG: polysaccharide deacetylase family protein [candidate division Zixibacteria bacterium]|nr:polysaccharide deacetylase family protein [candidate division Zixibacteria bacterium]